MILPISPQEAAQTILKTLPHRRMRDVIKKRFGLQGGRKITLQSIGRDYKITRERVRQIETDALKWLRREEVTPTLAPLFKVFETHLENHGGVMTEHQLLAELGMPRERPHIVFLLNLGKQFSYLTENRSYFDRWALDMDRAKAAEEFISRILMSLEEKKHPVSQQELTGILTDSARELWGEVPQENALKAYIRISKLIRQNPYGDWGLISRPTINPRGVRDKAYLALVKSGKPLHFTEVARAIARAGWSKKWVHPQTVHNELIKDKRFVLVGRGLYALEEWGCTPGRVSEVLVSLLKNAGRALERQEIIKLVCEKRLVKPQTVILNLQNKSLFRRLEDGKYTLV